jgi:hypothetical protein
VQGSASQEPPDPQLNTLASYSSPGGILCGSPSIDGADRIHCIRYNNLSLPELLSFFYSNIPELQERGQTKNQCRQFVVVHVALHQFSGPP